jgi:hypothetical protein
MTAESCVVRIFGIIAAFGRSKAERFGLSAVRSVDGWDGDTLDAKPLQRYGND